MNRIVSLTLFAAALAVAGLLPAESQAFGRRSSCCEPCGGCAPCAAPCEAPAPVKMVERQVTRYRQEWKEQEVTVNVCKMVPREEKFSYAVYVPVTREEKRNVTTYECVTRQVEYKYNVMVPHTHQEKKTVSYCEYEVKMV